MRNPLDVLWARVESLFRSHERFNRRITRLEQRMTSAEQGLWTNLGRLVGLIIAENQSLKDGLTTKQAALTEALAALEGKDEEAARKVQAAIDADANADSQRLTGLVDELKAALPPEAEVPDVPVPVIGEPAVLPGEGDANPTPDGANTGTGQTYPDGTPYVPGVPRPQPGTEGIPSADPAQTGDEPLTPGDHNPGNETATNANPDGTPGNV